MNFKFLIHKFLYFVLKSGNLKLTRLGNPCAWDIFLEGLDRNSIIVCAGAGNDISFELALHQATGASVLLLDPSPTGAKTVEKIPLDKKLGINFTRRGLAFQSGVQQFSLPLDAQEGSYALSQHGRETITFECISLADLMRENAFTRIDFLKMDIEGFEWDILRDILDKNIGIDQICVELHPMYGRLRSSFERFGLVIRMRMHGYKLVSHVGVGDHTFIKNKP